MTRPALLEEEPRDGTDHCILRISFDHSRYQPELLTPNRCRVRADNAEGARVVLNARIAPDADEDTSEDSEDDKFAH